MNKLNLLLITLISSGTALAGSKFIDPFKSESARIDINCFNHLTTKFESGSIFWTQAGTSPLNGALGTSLGSDQIVIEADWNSKELIISNLAAQTFKVISGQGLEKSFEIQTAKMNYTCSVISEDPNP